MIYIIQQVGTNFVKIGYTARDVYKRAEELQTGNPCKLSIISKFHGNEKVEKELRLTKHISWITA